MKSDTNSWILYSLILLGALSVCFFSWLPSPRISIYGYLPNDVGQWVDADANMNIRTAVPLCLLGFAGGGWLLYFQKRWIWWLGLLSAFVGIVVFAEMGQLWLPHRHFDWEDIGWGSGGALAGMLLGAMFALLVVLLRQALHHGKS